jgi:hypothetical protein
MKFQNNSGFSMVQIMIAAAMMGVLSLGMLQMMENQAKSNRSIKASNELQAFFNEARAYMGKTTYCTKNFGGEVMGEGEVLELDEIIKPNDKVLYAVGDIIGDRSLKIAKIEAIEFEKDTETTGMMKLRFTLEKLGKSYGAKFYKRSMKIDMATDEGGKVTACATLGNLATGFAGEGSPQAENAEQGVKDLQEGKETEAAKTTEEIIKSNSNLQSIQDSIDSMQQTNKKMEELFQE